jgi:hypothetical protein
MTRMWCCSSAHPAAQQQPQATSVSGTPMTLAVPSSSSRSRREEVEEDMLQPEAVACPLRGVAVPLCLAEPTCHQEGHLSAHLLLLATTRTLLSIPTLSLALSCEQALRVAEADASYGSRTSCFV